MKDYTWTVKIHISPIWVADGFDLDNDRLQDMLMSELNCATDSEVSGEVISAPDSKQIRVEQGYNVPGYKARYNDD